MQVFARFAFIVLLIIVFTAVLSNDVYAQAPSASPVSIPFEDRAVRYITRGFMGLLLPLVKYLVVAVCAGFSLIFLGMLFGYIGRLLGLRGRNLRRFEAGASRAFLRGRNVSKGKSGIPYVEDFGGKSYEIRFDK